MNLFSYTELSIEGVSPPEPTDPRVFRNDWSTLTPPTVGSWTPGPTVSIVIPARNNQRQLDRLLACLTHQTYPAHLMEVVVVDDHSTPRLRLPDRRPHRCRIEPAPPDGWGPGHARAHGSRISSGEVLCWLDPDLLVEATLIETLVRWQHTHSHAVSFADLRYALDHDPDPVDAADPVVARTLRRRFPDAPPHPRIARLLARTNDLRDADSLSYQAFVGACVTMSRALYESAGGVNPALTLGHDTELGYRLWQHGAIFIPDREARAWHVGSATATRTRVPGLRSDALSTLVPYARPAYRPRRRGEHRVPMVLAVVDAAQHPYELVRACVDRLLASTGVEVDVVLVADWDTEADWWVEARLIQAHYLAEPRVRFASHPPRTGFPAPYLLRVSVTCGVAPRTVAQLVDRAEWANAGVVELVHDTPQQLTLWRTRALARTAAEPDDLSTAVAAIHGRYRMQGRADTVDLSAIAVPHDWGIGARRPRPLTLLRHGWNRLAAVWHRSRDAVRRRPREH